MKRWRYYLCPSWVLASCAFLLDNIAFGFTARPLCLNSFGNPRTVVLDPPSTAFSYNGRRANQLNAVFDNSFSDSPIPVWAIVVVTLILGFAANAWIQTLLSGDRGLGNFLSDGSGFGQSKFQPLTTKDQDRAVSGDPLPWLRLPDLDFVEVAGQIKQGSTDSSVTTDVFSDTYDSSNDSSNDSGGDGGGDSSD